MSADPMERLVRSLKDDLDEARAELAQARARETAVRELHVDTGGGQGYTDGGYGDFSTACSSCGTSDEYAVEWPCPTIKALDRAELSAPVEAGAPAEPGYQRIADAIEAACDTAALALTARRDGVPVEEPYLRLARVLDKAGLIDWAAFAGAPAEPTSDTEDPT